MLCPILKDIIIEYTSFLSSKYNDLIYLDLINIPWYHSSLLQGFSRDVTVHETELSILMVHTGTGAY